MMREEQDVSIIGTSLDVPYIIAQIIFVELALPLKRTRLVLLTLLSFCSLFPLININKETQITGQLNP